jgi:ATP-binding cassette subfamily B protein
MGIYKSLFGRVNQTLLIRLLRENLPKYWRTYAIATVAMLAIAATTALTAWIMGDVVNTSVIQRDYQQLLWISGGIAVIFTTKGIATYIQSYFMSRAGNAIVAEQQRKIYAKLLKQDLSYFQRFQSSDLIIRMTNNAQAARGVIDTIVTSFVRDLFSLLGLIAVMFIQQPVISAAVFVGGPVVFLGIRLLLQQVRSIMEKELMSLAQIVQIMQETTVGVRVVKAFSLEKKMEARMDVAVSTVEDRANAIARLEALTHPMMETLAGLIIAGVVAVSGYIFIENNQSPGELMSFITALLLAYEPAKRLARMRISLEAGMVGVRMMFDLLDHDIRLLEKPDATALARGEGAIVFNDVSFTYDAATPVLTDVNLTFAAGKMTALVGPSGSGKSTMINLMMRLYDPVSGTVMIDGTDLREVTFKSLRDRIAYVSQDTFLFNDTILNNIGYGRPDATREEIEQAAKMANAHSFIVEQSSGYDTMVGENGTSLSGGQKQRLAIARAMLRDADILILDEATSSLDSQSEALIQQAIDRLTREKTTIVIAHRLSTVAKASAIVVLSNGRVEDVGTHGELIKRDGLYMQLHKAQFAENTDAMVA